MEEEKKIRKVTSKKEATKKTPSKTIKKTTTKKEEVKKPVAKKTTVKKTALKKETPKKTTTKKVAVPKKTVLENTREIDVKELKEIVASQKIEIPDLKGKEVEEAKKELDKLKILYEEETIKKMTHI